MKSAKASLAIPCTHRRCFGICTVCLSLYIAYTNYLSQSGFLTGGVKTVASLRVCRAQRVLVPPAVEGCSGWPGCRPRRIGGGRRVFGGAGYFGGHLWLRVCGVLARRRQL